MRETILAPLMAAILAASGLRTAGAEEPPPRCLFDDPARAVAARAADEAPACAAMDREAARPEELILPLPCGHVMHFRRVDVAVDHLLGQVAPLYGDPNGASASPAQSSAVAPWSDVLSGAFTVAGPDGMPTDRAYYIGKYEITLPQWRLFETGLFAEGLAAYDPAAPACAAHAAWLAAAGVRDGYGRPDLVLPATGLSWFDAVAFSRAWSAWLVEIDRRLIGNGARPVLPWADGSPGFVRLPTEAEWEFAARDGAVGGDAQNRRLHRVRAGTGAEADTAEPALGDIAQTEGWGGHPVHGVGRLAPNLLGLHDMLGNAEEYVLDLFRATRPDGLHGQRGGAVLRGGSPATPTANISLGYRREAALFGIAGETRPPLAGARLAVSAPFFVRGAPEGQPFPVEDYANPALDAALSDSRARLVARDVQVGDMAGLIARIRETGEGGAGADPAEARALLEAGLQLLEKSAAEGATAAREALRQRFITGATLATAISRTGANINDALVRPAQIREKILESTRYSEEERTALLARVEAVVESLAVREREIEEIYATYLDNLAGLVAEPDAGLLGQVEEKVAARFASPSLAKLAEAYAAQSAHLAEWRTRGARDDEMARRWLYEIDQTRAERDDKRGE